MSLTLFYGKEIQHSKYVTKLVSVYVSLTSCAMWRMSCSSLVANVVCQWHFYCGSKTRNTLKLSFASISLPQTLQTKIFSYGLHWKIICIAFHMVCNNILHRSVFWHGLYWSVLGSHLSFLVYPYNVSQIKLLCQDTTKMLLCLWHLCSACQNRLFNLHFFPLQYPLFRM